MRYCLKKKYYYESAFNHVREASGDFKIYDRESERIDGHKMERMDLFEMKDKISFAVKVGSCSSKLCYAIDQSLTSLKLYKQGTITYNEKVNAIGLWFILDKHEHIEDNNNNNIPNLNKLNMIMLKNRIDQWKKEVRLAGLQPMIYINYKH